ncbi:MAG: type II toxin-antitoxin system RelE/ParE family toxin [Acidobacteria bacterium]|nr:type II toxin-antitoxin system RelE/ParE family toxin [Acidobacteriota bacterium]
MAYPAPVKPASLKPVVWMGDSLVVLRAFPKAVQEEIGYALHKAQLGEKHERAKPLKGFGSGVLEVVSDHRGDTFRAVYTVRLAGKVYVLHAFQKKSTRGIATPKSELGLVQQRLKRAMELHAQQED